MIILGIETSCDETAASIVENGTKIISNVVATSADMHAKTGGVIPEQAAREQVKSILPVIREALLPIPYSLVPKINAIAVTVGPGLIGSLLVGIETAKTLAYLWDKPIIPVNHLVGHIYANWLASPKSQDEGGLPEFPALALVVSGGHTDLVVMKNHKNIKWIGGTRDDAAGEAFDKTARLLGLPYPGGPAISQAAEKYLNSSIVNHKSLNLFPRPMANEDNFDWSFSGLKTAVSKEVQKLNPVPYSLVPGLCAQIQEAIVDSLVIKSLRAIEKFQPKSFLLAGGVAANKRLREKLAVGSMHHAQASVHGSGNILRAKLHVPEAKLCTDNAAYIAAAAFFHQNFVDWPKITALPQLTITDQVEV